MDLSEVTSNRYRHPWEISRADSVIYEFKHDALFDEILNNNSVIIDIGCGDGYFDCRLLSAYPGIERIYGVDINLKEDYSKGRLTVVNSLSKVPVKSADIIFMMDVLEHIDKVNDYVREFHDNFKCRGYMIITVPAFNSLFSEHDVILKHYRRYDYQELASLMTTNGYKVLQWHYFFSCLVPLRIFTRHKDHSLSEWKHKEGTFGTNIVRFVLNTDYRICRMMAKAGIRIRGLSMFMIVSE